MSEGGTKRKQQEVFVVCGEAGKPHRAYEERENAEELLEHWREGPMNVRGSIEVVDLIEFRSVDTGTDRSEGDR